MRSRLPGGRTALRLGGAAAALWFAFALGSELAAVGPWQRAAPPPRAATPYGWRWGSSEVAELALLLDPATAAIPPDTEVLVVTPESWGNEGSFAWHWAGFLRPDLRFTFFHDAPSSAGFSTLLWYRDEPPPAGFETAAARGAARLLVRAR